VLVELSKDRDFSTVCVTSHFPCSGPDEPVKVALEELEPATRYFCRCVLQQQQEDEGGQTEPPAEGSVHYAICHFWTLVDVSSSDRGEEVAHQDVEFLAMNGHAHHQLGEEEGGAFEDGSEVRRAEAPRPLFSVLLGDLLGTVPVSTEPTAPSPSLDAQLWSLFRSDPIFSPFSAQSERNSVLSMSSMLCAWNDSQTGSDTGLKAEEIVHKQWSYDTRKYEKKQKEKLEKEK
jgi:hypothetical protein